MNQTIKKFGYPATLIREYDHWVVLLRPAQPTLGSLVLASKSECTDFSALPREAFAELATITVAIEGVMRDFVDYAKMNYLMLMMVDPNVHFHVIPRYDGTRKWGVHDFADAAWPGPPALGEAVKLSDGEIAALTAELSENFSR